MLFRSSTFAGNRQYGSTGDGGAATVGAIHPGAMAFGPDGSLYFVEFDFHKVRRITPEGTLRLVAGTGMGTSSGDNGPAISASLNNPCGIAVNAAGDVHVSEFNGDVIRSISAGGAIRLFAGSRSAGLTPDGTPAAQARFAAPCGLAFDSTRNLYVADVYNFRVRVVDTALTVSTAVGDGGYRNAADGTGIAGAFFDGPRGLSFDPAGNLVVVDSNAQRVRRLDTNGTFRTIAGNGDTAFIDNGVALESAFSGPVGVVAGPSGSVYVADTFHHWVRRIDGTGISIVAGNGSAAFSGDNSAATNAALNRPHGLALDSAGNLYIADEFNHRIRRVAANGTITTVAGNGVEGSSGDNGPATQASLRNPFAVAFDRAGNMYIAESQGHVVRRVDTGGIITTVAGTGRAGFGGDGGPARAALLNAPAALVFDAAGNLYIGERDGHRVRRVDTAGVITTVAGTGVAGFSGDGGRANLAALDGPNGGLAVDAAGNLYISDTGNNRIRVVTAGATTLQTSSTSLSFRATSNGPSSEGQSLNLTSNSLGLPYSIAIRTAAGGNWLRATPTAGTLPASITVFADPTNVAAGSYNGTLTISAPNAASVAVAVTFTVAPSNPPRLSVEPDSLTFSIPENGSSEQVLFVSNLGGGTLMFTVGQAGVSWLSSTPLSFATGGVGTCPNCSSSSISGGGGVRLAADARGLAPGIYRTSVTLTNPATNETSQVPVTMSVTPSGRPSIRVSQTGLTFRLITGLGATPQCFAVLNLGQGSLDFSVSSDSPWISVRRAPCPYRAVSSPAPIPEVVVEMRPEGLSAGDHEGQITVTSSNADNSPQKVTVKLKVLPPGSTLGPDIYPTGLVFSGTAGGSAPGSLGIVINNISERPFDFYSNSGFETAPWFSYQPRSGVVRPTAAGEQGTVITVQPDAGNLSAGLYYGFLTLATREYGGRVVNALLALGGGGGKSGRAAGACPEGTVSLLHTAASQDFVATRGQPFPIEVYATDGCGGPLTSGSVIASFSNGDPVLTLTAIGDGRWTGTWTPARGSDNAVTITVRGSDGTVPGQLSLIGRLQ